MHRDEETLETIRVSGNPFGFSWGFHRSIRTRLEISVAPSLRPLACLSCSGVLALAIFRVQTPWCSVYKKEMGVFCTSALNFSFILAGFLLCCLLSVGIETTVCCHLGSRQHTSMHKAFLNCLFYPVSRPQTSLWCLIESVLIRIHLCHTTLETNNVLISN